jgi:outer membrane immunogenic protein
MRVLAALGCLLVATNLAFAADIAPPPYPQPVPPPVYAPVPPPPPFTWSGIYIGANAGYGFADASLTASGFVSGTLAVPVSGFIGGGQVGANYQFGYGVIGIEADFDGSLQNATISIGGYSVTGDINYFGTVRGRVGVAFDRVLVYATGGAGYGWASSTLTFPVFPAGSASVTSTSSHLLWVGGAGVEFAITNNVSARGEWLYLDTGSIPVGTIGLTTVSRRIEDNLVRAGLNWRFVL